MSNNQLGVFSEGDAREIHKRVLGHTLPLNNIGDAKQYTVQNMLYYAVLTEDLAAATNETTGYTQAECRIIRYVQPVSATSLDMELSTSAAALITVTNRYTTFSAGTDDLILVIRNGAEWSPVNVEGGRLQVVFTTDLLAAVNTKRDPSTASARILRRKVNGDLTLSTDTVTVVNRFKNISIDAGTYAKIEWLDGEWQPYAADCPGGSASSGSV